MQSPARLGRGLVAAPAAWHVYRNIFPGEAADRTPLAYRAFHQGRWILINQGLDSLKAPSGNKVPRKQAVALDHGNRILLSDEPNGRMAEVQIVTLR
jgi:hypothetical protein